MLYNVSSLLKEHTGASREFEVDDDLQFESETHHVTGHVRLDRTPRGILVRAVLRGATDAQCVRCLAPVSIPIEITIEEEFIPSIDVNTGARVQIDEGDEEAYRINARHQLDLREPARQYWAMAMPMAPLCREDCPGICAFCGKDAGPNHACAEQPVDERWAKLSQLGKT
jgi:uncharacterized protein